MILVNNTEFPIDPESSLAGFHLLAYNLSQGFGVGQGSITKCIQIVSRVKTITHTSFIWDCCSHTSRLPPAILLNLSYRCTVPSSLCANKVMYDCSTIFSINTIIRPCFPEPSQVSADTK